MRPAHHTWERPALVAVRRPHPEEAVLTACKTGGPGAGAPHTRNNSCLGANPACTSACALTAAS
jgi:hypothetical protein